RLSGVVEEVRYEVGGVGGFRITSLWGEGMPPLFHDRVTRGPVDSGPRPEMFGDSCTASANRCLDPGPVGVRFKTETLRSTRYRARIGRGMEEPEGVTCMQVGWAPGHGAHCTAG